MLFNAGQLSIQVSDCTNFREQIQNAQENPIQAQSKSNVENLLDLDLSATAEDRVASPSIPNNTTTNILEDLGSLSLSSSPAPPSQVTSPPHAQFGSTFGSPPTTAPTTQFESAFGSLPPTTLAPANNMNDLLGVFGGAGQNSGGFGGENVWSDIPQQNGTQPNKSTNEDILGLF